MHGPLKPSLSTFIENQKSQFASSQKKLKPSSTKNQGKSDAHPITLTDEVKAEVKKERIFSQRRKSSDLIEMFKSRHNDLYHGSTSQEIGRFSKPRRTSADLIIGRRQSDLVS